jgi:hypothetical protein
MANNDPRTVEASVSEQSVRLLDELVRMGIYGIDRADVAGRFIDGALVDLLGKNGLKLKPDKSKKQKKVRQARL